MKTLLRWIVEIIGWLLIWWNVKPGWRTQIPVFLGVMAIALAFQYL